jgi:hypothetical protein
VSTDKINITTKGFSTILDNRLPAVRCYHVTEMDGTQIESMMTQKENQVTVTKDSGTVIETCVDQDLLS